jgi:hypothetical protein
VLAGFRMPEAVYVNSFPVKGFQQVVGKGHIVPDAIGKIDGIGFFIGNHIYLLIYYKSTICNFFGKGMPFLCTGQRNFVKKS